MKKTKMTLQEAKDFIENNVQIDIRYCSDEEVNKTKEAFEIAMAAIDLADSQKAEIERLQSILLRFLNELSEWGDKNNVDTTNFSIIPIVESEKESLVKQLKIEITEAFAEVLKNKAAQKCNSEYCAYIDDIDSTVKEWTEEQ